MISVSFTLAELDVLMAALDEVNPTDALDHLYDRLSEAADHLRAIEDGPADPTGDPTPGDAPGYRASMIDAGRGGLLR